MDEAPAEVEAAAEVAPPKKDRIEPEAPPPPPLLPLPETLSEAEAQAAPLARGGLPGTRSRMSFLCSLERVSQPSISSTEAKFFLGTGQHDG